MGNTQKKKFTGIDVFIILAVLAVIAVGAAKTGLLRTSAQENTAVLFDVLISECEDHIAGAVSEGDEVSISNKEKDTARVKAVRTEPTKSMTYNSAKGFYYMKELSNKEDLYITLEADASITDTLIKTGTTPIKVGLGIPVRGKGYALTGYIVNIDTEYGGYQNDR